MMVDVAEDEPEAVLVADVGMIEKLPLSQASCCGMKGGVVLMAERGEVRKLMAKQKWRADKPTQAERHQTRGYQLFWSLQSTMCSLVTMRMLHADQIGLGPITWSQRCHATYAAGSKR